MSQQLINRSADLSRLVDEGFALRIEGGILVVEEIPYLDSAGMVQRGCFVCPLDESAGATVAPSDHVMSFTGSFPHDRRKKPIPGLGNVGPRHHAAGFRSQSGFSNKPSGPRGARPYRDFHEKVTTYAHIIVTEAQAIFPSAAANVGVLPRVDGDSPFEFLDTASARVGISDLSAAFNDEVIAIIGLGGTGSYILDQVAKTPVREILLIDGDKFLPHNAFRAPGAAGKSDFAPLIFKVDYHASRYARMKRGIRPISEALTAANIALLEEVTFVFISMDPGPEKAHILDHLHQRRVPFVDVGMGLSRSSNGLVGALRSVCCTSENHDAVRKKIPQHEQPDDGIYRTNIQVAELNAMNAMMAVMQWKAYRGFYADFGAAEWILPIEMRKLIREAA